MAFPDTIEDLTDGTVDHDFDLYDEVDGPGRGRIRKDIASSLAEPAFLKIAHQNTGSGLAEVQRTLVRTDVTKIDSDGNPQVGSMYSNIVDPFRVFTQAEMKEVCLQHIDFLNTAGNIDKLINGES